MRTTPILNYFEPYEFGEWWEYMDETFLLQLDEFRRNWKGPVQISPHPDALGRELGDSMSMHNIERWGVLKAADVFPMYLERVNGISRLRYISTTQQRIRAYEAAIYSGFNGIGIYTDTRPGDMLHLDTREGQLATWSRVNGQYLGVDLVIN